MVSAGDLKDLAMVPVRGTVYLVKLPFGLVWMVVAYIGALLYSVVAKILSVPANYVRRAARRIQLTWNWTKTSAKSFMPWRSTINANAQREICPYQPPRPPYERDDLFYGGNHRLEPHMHRSHGRGRRSRRKDAIIASLIRILMEPGSPVESEEETEILSKSDDEGEEDKVYKLIRDLIQFSRPGKESSVPHQSSLQQGLDLETLRRHARDRDKLQVLICELDQYVKSMESGSQPSAEGVEQRSLSREELLVTPDRDTVASNADTDLYVDASEGEGQGSVEEEESDGNYGEEFDNARSSLHLDSPPPICRGLSPVAEVSPEVASMGSTESLEKRCVDLETELNTAMLKLTTLTDELAQVEQESTTLECRQTTLSETVVTTSVPTEATPESRKTCNQDSHEDTSGDFACIPLTSPTLGLEAGHSRRSLATARKARPPSQSRGAGQAVSDGAGDSNRGSAQLGKEGSREFEGGSSEASFNEDDGEEGRATSHSLSDQLKLLTPMSGHHQQRQDQQERTGVTSDLYSSVNKKRSGSEGDNASVGHLEASRTRSASLTGTGTSGKTEQTPEKSLFIHDLTPPWKQMRSRNSPSSSTSSPSTTPIHLSEHSGAHHLSKHGTPPPLPPRSLTPPPAGQSQSAVPAPHGNHSAVPGSSSAQDKSPSLYDKLPRILPAPPIPSRAGEEGLYDIIPCRRPYLHERLAVTEKKKEQLRATPPVSWTPQLPPRNGTSKLKRTSSAEAMGTIPRDQEVLFRRGSERRASSSSARESRERSESSSSSRRRSSSTERDRERRVTRDRPSSEHHHHHRSSDKPAISKHRNSSEKHHSSDKKSSPSSSKSSSSSSKSKQGSEGIGAGIWKILTSPSSSKTKSSSSSSKKSEASSSSSSSKKSERGERERRRSSEKERERRKEEKERKPVSSSRSKPDSESSRPRKRSSAQRREEESDIPRNESSSSLKSGVSVLSSDSSGRESLI